MQELKGNFFNEISLIFEHIMRITKEGKEEGK